MKDWIKARIEWLTIKGIYLYNWALMRQGKLQNVSNISWKRVRSMIMLEMFMMKSNKFKKDNKYIIVYT